MIIIVIYDIPKFDQFSFYSKSEFFNLFFLMRFFHFTFFRFISCWKIFCFYFKQVLPSFLISRYLYCFLSDLKIWCWLTRYCFSSLWAILRIWNCMFLIMNFHLFNLTAPHWDLQVFIFLLLCHYWK